MCMGKPTQRMIYAVHPPNSRVPFEPLTIVHDWDSANDVVHIWALAWEREHGGEIFAGDFIAAWNSEIWIYTSQPDCPVVWQICQGQEIL